MIKVIVKAFATLREVIGESGRTIIELPDGATIKDLLDALLKTFNDRFKTQVLDENGLPKKTVKIFVNGRDIDFLSRLNTSLKDGDEVALIPPIAGGKIHA